MAAVVKADAMVGTNIGGWLVLEPWITPSLFYRFLGKTHDEGVAIDSWTMCEVLGARGGNEIMRTHWDNWITEDTIKALKEREVEIVRLPLGDWTLNQYGPYVGCMDGADEKIDWFLKTAHEYGIKVLLDFHALKGSQNGYDNSGRASDLEWPDENHYKHWSVRNAHWQGEIDWETKKVTLNYENINWAKDQVRAVMERWGNHPAVYALEPINEPWDYSDVPALKEWYRDLRQIVHDINPEVIFVFYPSTFAMDWEDTFEDSVTNVALDTHFYTAWNGRSDDIETYCDAYASYFDSIKDSKYDLWVGEWSLATDTCAFWLGGFNEGSYHQFDCKQVECPKTYMPAPYDIDFDRNAAVLGPYGEDQSSLVHSGMCMTDSDFFYHQEVQRLGDCSREVFDRTVKAQFLWTARNELESKWNYVEAYDKGWINKNRNNKFLN